MSWMSKLSGYDVLNSTAGTARMGCTSDYGLDVCRVDVAWSGPWFHRLQTNDKRPATTPACKQVQQVVGGACASLPAVSLLMQLGPGNLSYLLTWRGSRPDLDPVLFVAHTDVVPVAPETLKVGQHNDSGWGHCHVGNDD
jgi:hypothetical protein